MNDADLAELVTRYQAGQSTRELARHFGVSQMTIVRNLPDDVERRPVGWVQAHDVGDDEIIALRDGGLSWHRLAEAVGMSMSGARRRYFAALRRRG